MPKVYQEKPESEELFLRLTGGHDSVLLEIVDEHGSTEWSLVEISDRGIELASTIPELKAARADLTNAVDANGRLKVIGQEVEEVEAERMQSHSYKCDVSDVHVLRVESMANPARIAIGLVVDGLCTTNVILNAKQIRTLADTLNRHLAYLEQEGLDKP